MIAGYAFVWVNSRRPARKRPSTTGEILSKVMVADPVLVNAIQAAWVRLMGERATLGPSAPQQQVSMWGNRLPGERQALARRISLLNAAERRWKNLPSLSS
jgi:hypothetical protein